MQRVATIGRLRLWHQSPKNTECDQSYHGDCHKTGCQSKVSHDHTGECGTERSSDTGNRTDKALGEVESTRAASRVSNRQWLQYTEHDSADAIQDLDGNQDHWFRNQRKQQGTDRQNHESDEQQRAAPRALNLPPRPWRHQGGVNLGHNDEDRHNHRRLPTFMTSQHFADQR